MACFLSAVTVTHALSVRDPPRLTARPSAPSRRAPSTREPTAPRAGGNPVTTCQTL